jgi:hypothetical protein
MKIDKRYSLVGQKISSYRLTVNASSPDEATAKAKAGDADVECSDVLSVELRVSCCEEVEQ